MIVERREEVICQLRKIEKWTAEAHHRIAYALDLGIQMGGAAPTDELRAAKLHIMRQLQPGKGEDVAGGSKAPWAPRAGKN